MDTQIAKRLKEKRVNYSPYQWEGGYNWIQDSINSYEDLKKLLLEKNTNTKIFTMLRIIPEIIDLLSQIETRDLAEVLQTQLSDNRMCEISYPGSYADEEDDSTVASSARFALQQIRNLEGKNSLETKCQNAA